MGLHRYPYSSFGETTSTSGVGFEPWFGGMRYLPSVGLYLGRNRVLNPKHGIWLGLDPLGYKDSPNLYAYAGQNPIDFVDPMGLSKDGPAEISIFLPERTGPPFLPSASLTISEESHLIKSSYPYNPFADTNVTRIAQRKKTRNSSTKETGDWTDINPNFTTDMANELPADFPYRTDILSAANSYNINPVLLAAIGENETLMGKLLDKTQRGDYGHGLAFGNLTTKDGAGN